MDEFVRQQHEMMRMQQNQQRLYQRQCLQQQHEMQRELNKQQREMQRIDAQYSKYPKLTDKFIKECLTLAIYNMYVQAYGMQNRVPEPVSLIHSLKFRRIKAEQPEYVIKGQAFIKHACKFKGVSANPVNLLDVIYYSPHGVRYNHNYNYKLPYFYCRYCHAVIYYFNDVEEFRNGTGS